MTRPLGTPINHSSIPFQISMQSASQIMNLQYQQDRSADLLKQADEITKTLEIMQQQYALQQEMAATTHEQVRRFMKRSRSPMNCETRSPISTTYSGRFATTSTGNRTATTFRCAAAVRSLFDALDGIDQLSQQLASLTASFGQLDALQPQLVELIPPQIASQQTNRELILSNYATMSGIYDQTAAMIDNATAMGQAFDAAKNDDSFYLPPEAFDNPDFKRGLQAVPVAGRQGRPHDHFP